MLKTHYLIPLVVILASCSQHKPADNSVPTADTSAPSAHTTSKSRSQNISASSIKEIETESLVGIKSYTSPNKTLHLLYADNLEAEQNFSGRALMQSGWRIVWRGDVGPGTGIVSFEQEARPEGEPGSVFEILRIGMSKDPKTVKDCTTFGLDSGSRHKLPDRTINGIDWTVYGNGDAGMSQEIQAIDLRTVYKGSCYAVDRITYSVKAAETPPASIISQTRAAAQIDDIVETIRLK